MYVFIIKQIQVSLVGSLHNKKLELTTYLVSVKMSSFFFPKK